MSALEQEVLEKYRLLDKEAQQRVLVLMRKETSSETPQSQSDKMASLDVSVDEE